MRPDDLDAVMLHGMCFHTLIGVLPHDREYLQPLEIDLTAWIRQGEGEGPRTLDLDIVKFERPR